MKRPSTIVAFGGMRPIPRTVHPLVTYILGLTGKPRPKVAFIPTATGDSTAVVAGFYGRVPSDLAEVTHLNLFDRTVKDIASYLLSQDVIWVGGGNTASMLAVWRAHDVDVALREAWELGVVMTGGSAGSLCWFECGTTDSFDLYELQPLDDGLGFLKGSHCPHYDGEVQRRPLYHSLVSNGFPAGIAIDDDAAVRFDGDQIAEVVTARRGATAYRVFLSEQTVVETPLEATLID
ncbi:MAG: Type 1 glutamine amidotransferase-like domain-containing protein [Actinomycetota bacterium]|nr:peptidase E [Actinomycetota bacterium]